jgi:hypothetical protein
MLMGDNMVPQSIRRGSYIMETAMKGYKRRIKFKDVLYVPFGEQDSC